MSTGLTLMYFCKLCEHGYCVPAADPDKKLLNLLMPCPTRECSGKIEYGDPQTTKQQATMPAKILFEACMGRGFPEDRECSPEHLRSVLLNGEIIALELEEAGPNRSFILSMEVETEDAQHKVFFAMSTRGATIYKIEEMPDV